MEQKKPYNKVSYNREYNEKNYDRIALTVPKGKKEEIKAYADGKGEPVNAFINRIIEEAMQKDK